MRLLFFTFIFSLLCGLVAAQETNVRKSKNDAFLLGKTSPEQAAAILGKPQSDKTERLDVLLVRDWVGKNFKEKEARVLLFYPFEDLGKVKLSFLNEKLVAINFIVEKDIYAAELSDVYRIQFVPVFNDFSMKPSVGEFDKQTKDVLVADFPRVYHLVGTNKSSVLTARIFNGKAANPNVTRELKMSPQPKIKTNPISGKVTDIQILSRTILK